MNFIRNVTIQIKLINQKGLILIFADLQIIVWKTINFVYVYIYIYII